MTHLLGKRIIVFWTNKAFNAGNDWPAFRVLDVGEDQLWCEGVTSPDGCPHDGTKVAINVEDTYNIIEWKEP